MSKKKLILHIGLHKTGTTSIQHGLFTNRKLLAEHGVLYPTTGLHPHGQHNLTWEIKQDDRFNAKLGTWQDFYQEAQAFAGNMILISCEDYCTMNPEQQARVPLFLKDFDVTVVVYLRNQTSLLPSTYAQLAKSGRQVGDFATWLKQKSLNVPRYHYDQLIASWEQIFGAERIRVGILEEASAYPSILTHFLTVCSLPLVDIAMEQPPRKNISPSYQTVETIRQMAAALHGYGYPFAAIRPIAHSLMAHAQHSGWNTEKLQLLTEDTYQQIVDHFHESNQRVAQKYFGRDTLFEPREQEFTAPEQRQYKITEFTEALTHMYEQVIEQKQPNNQ